MKSEKLIILMASIFGRWIIFRFFPKKERLDCHWAILKSKSCRKNLVFALLLVIFSPIIIPLLLLLFSFIFLFSFFRRLKRIRAYRRMKGSKNLAT